MVVLSTEERGKINYIQGLKKCCPCRWWMLIIRLYSTCNIQASYWLMATEHQCNRMVCHLDVQAFLRVCSLDYLNIRIIKRNFQFAQLRWEGRTGYSVSLLKVPRQAWESIPSWKWQSFTA